MEQMNFWKKLTILIVRMSNFYLHNLSHSSYQLLTPGNLQSALTEGDRCRLPVAPYQSKRLTSLGIARRQTVVLLLSTLRIIMPQLICPLGFQSFCFNRFPDCGSPICCGHTDGQSIRQALIFSHAYLWVLRWIGLLASRIHTLSSSARLFINSVLRVDCCNYSLSAKYKHVQNHSNLFEHEEKWFLTHSNWRGTVANIIISGHSIN